MTVTEWIERRSAGVPESLTREVLAALGEHGDADQTETGRACMRSATRLLATLLRERAFGRESALRLLTVDALTTYALEHAAEEEPNAAAVSEFARLSVNEVGQVLVARG